MSVAGVHRIPEKTIHIYEEGRTVVIFRAISSMPWYILIFVRQPGEKKVNHPNQHSEFQCLTIENKRWLTSEILPKRIKMSGFSWNLARWKTDRSPDLLFTLAVSRLFVPLRCLADVFTFSAWRCRVWVVSTHFKNIHLNERQQKMPRSKDIYSGTAKVKQQVMMSHIFETTNYTQSPTLWFSDCTSISVNQVYKLHSHEGGGNDDHLNGTSWCLFQY